MSVIAVVDDRKDVRETMAGLIQKCLDREAPGWRAIDTEPLEQISDYSKFIKMNEVAVLIVDEKLAEQPNKSGEAVSYAGHDIVSYLRGKLPSFPIFVITAHEDDDELKKRSAEAEDVINRNDDWNTHYAMYVTRMIRRGRVFIDEYQTELSEVSQISEKIAEGKATSKEKERLSALQAKLSLALPLDVLETRSEWVTRSEAQVELLEKKIVSLEKSAKKK